jgi:mRNA-degrading endonuclease RelE of RelBE toxin-antitoxin system
MPYSFRFTGKAREDILKLDKIIQQRMLRKITYFESLDDIKSVSKKLKDFELSEYRIRIGDYRLFIDIVDNNIIEVVAVRHRRNAYED